MRSWMLVGHMLRPAGHTSCLCWSLMLAVVVDRHLHAALGMCMSLHMPCAWPPGREALGLDLFAATFDVGWWGGAVRRGVGGCEQVWHAGSRWHNGTPSVDLRWCSSCQAPWNHAWLT